MKTIEYINELLKQELSKVRKDDETDVYSYLDFYLNKIYLCNVKELDENEINKITSADKTWNDLIRYIENSIKTILECYRTYIAGKIGESIQLMSDFLKKNNAPLRIGKIDTNTYFYRMRLKEEKGQHPFQAKEMFHVPFSKRYLLHSYRYSVLGYPCLYLSNSILGCWEEMDEPAMKDMFISCIKTEKEIKILDLALPYDNKDEYDVLCSWPLVFACSLKVKYPKHPFKPEYVIPQLVMQALVQTSAFDGCLYTSTHRNENFNVSEKLMHNFAIPAKEYKYNHNFCPRLSNAFSITNAICYEYELIKGNISWGNGIIWGEIPSSNNDSKNNDDYDKLYEGSVYGQMENILKGMTFHKITE